MLPGTIKKHHDSEYSEQEGQNPIMIGSSRLCNQINNGLYNKRIYHIIIITYRRLIDDWIITCLTECPKILIC